MSDENTDRSDVSRLERYRGSSVERARGPVTRRAALRRGAAVVGAGLLYGTGTGSGIGAGTGTTGTGSTASKIVLVVGDGQGVNHLKSARGLKAVRAGRTGFDVSLEVDRHAVTGQATTANVDGGITDSAAAGTAMSTGFRTKNGVVGGVIDSNGRFVSKETVLETAKKAGYRTGLVTTSTVTDATPAAFGAHTPDRTKQADIARQYIEETGVDVLLGGGRRYFSSTLRDKAKAAGYKYVTTASKLAGLSGSGKTLGLFVGGSMSGTVTRFNTATKQPNMDLMVRKAMERLGTGKSFLLVENEHIDTYGHSNWAGLPHDVLELDTAGTKQALDAAAGDMLVVTAGDHETGGLSFTSSPDFGVVDDLTASDTTLRKRIDQANKDPDLIRAIVADGTGIDDLTTLEMESLLANSGNIRRIVSNRAGFTWTTTKHTRTDVPTFATGPGAASLQGQTTLTDLAEVMRSVIA